MANTLLAMEADLWGHLQVVLVLLVLGFVAWVGYWALPQNRERQNKWVYWGARSFIWVAIGLPTMVAFLTAGLIGVIYLFVSQGWIAPPGGPSEMAHMIVFGVMLGLVGLGGILSLVPMARQGFQRFFFPGLDASSPVHMWALFTFFTINLFLAVITAFLYDPNSFVDTFTGSSILVVMSLTVVSYSVFAFLASGYGVIRGFKQTLQSLGLTPISWGQFGWMVACGFGLLVVGQLLQPLLLQFVDPEILRGIEQMMGGLNEDQSSSQVFLTAIILGLGAGISEEVVFRGLVQPVFGLWWTSVFFMLIHMQYGPTVLLLQLLFLGLAFGIVRQRVNTTAAIVVHASYDFFVVISTLVFG